MAGSGKPKANSITNRYGSSDQLLHHFQALSFVLLFTDYRNIRTLSANLDTTNILAFYFKSCYSLFEMSLVGLDTELGYVFSEYNLTLFFHSVTYLPTRR